MMAVRYEPEDVLSIILDQIRDSEIIECDTIDEIILADNLMGIYNIKRERFAWQWRNNYGG